MKQILAITMVVSFAAAPAALLNAQKLGVIEGTVSGDSGPVAGGAVNLANAEGLVVRTTRTGSAGNFAFEQVPWGRYVVLVANSSGAVVSTSVVTLNEEQPTATVQMTATQGARQGGAVTASAAGAGNVRMAAITAGLSAAASAAAAVAVVRVTDDASPSK